MKRLIIKTILCISLLCWGAIGYASAVQIVPLININGSPIMLDDNTGKSFIKNGVTLVPIRVISESMGYKVDWNETTKKITITKDATTVVLTVGSRTATINGVNKALIEAPIVKNNRTYVPLRFIGEAFGCDVVWDSPIVYIATTGKVVIPKAEAKPITSILKPNKLLDLINMVASGDNKELMVTQSTLEKGITLKTDHIAGLGDTFTITGMQWDGEDKTIILATANGVTSNKMAFKMAAIENGVITKTYMCRSVVDLGNGKVQFSVDGDSIITGDTYVIDADYLMFYTGDGTAVMIPNPVNDIPIKKY